MSLRCGVRREYQNPLYNYKEDRLSPFRLLTRLFLPVEYLDYSPDIACNPTVLFVDLLQGKCPACDQRLMRVPQRVQDRDKSFYWR